MLIKADALALPFADRSFDAVVTDPPYNLAFMGKEWDGVGTPVEFQRWCETWGREVLRVVKPGGHMCCFGGTRTAHRLACGLEDAGWEIRDCLAWVYGGGFPKSLDVGKAIDRARYDGAEVLEVTQWIKAARDRAGLSNGDIDAAFGFNGMAGHWTSQASQPAVPTLDQVPKLLELLGVEPPERIRRLLLDANGFAGDPGPNWWKREKIGKHLQPAKSIYSDKQLSDDVDITAPATEAAKQWDGWGTALKPSIEIVYLCRAPLSEPTIAANVQRWGCGALWIDGCRVKSSEDLSGGVYRNSQKVKTKWGGFDRGIGEFTHPGGRWPANLLLCHSHAEGEPCGEDCPVAMLDGQSGASVASSSPPGKLGRPGKLGFSMSYGGTCHGDRGGASRYFKRFFFSGKASSRERMGAVHPTIKPVAVFRYLTRLICPPGGIVLDPFCGSGTIKLAAEPIARKAVGSDKAYQGDARKRTRQKTLWGI